MTARTRTKTIRGVGDRSYSPQAPSRPVNGEPCRQHRRDHESTFDGRKSRDDGGERDHAEAGHGHEQAAAHLQQPTDKILQLLAGIVHRQVSAATGAGR
jgi:hypothetical protein